MLVRLGYREGPNKDGFVSMTKMGYAEQRIWDIFGLVEMPAEEFDELMELSKVNTEEFVEEVFAILEYNKGTHLPN